MQQTQDIEKKATQETRRYYWPGVWLGIAAFCVAGLVLYCSLKFKNNTALVLCAVAAVAEIIILTPVVVRIFCIGWLKYILFIAAVSLFFVLLQAESDFVLAVCSGAALIAIGLFVYTVCTIMLVYWYIGKTNEKRDKDKELQGIVFFEGPPGSGKSTDCGQTMIAHSQAMWEKVKYRKKLYDTLTAKGRKLSKKKLRDYAQVTECVDFWTKHDDLIPCLASTVPLLHKERTAYPVSAEHLLQIEKLPYFTDLLLDEVGSIIDIMLHKINPQNLKETARFPRHFFGNGVLIGCCEQDADGGLVYLRRSMAFRKLELGQTWIMKPQKLLERFDKLKEKFMANMNPPVELADKLIALSDRFEKIGFRQLKHIRFGGETNDVKLSGEVTEIVPAALDYDADDRPFQNWLQCKDKKPRYDKFKDDIIEPERRANIITAKNYATRIREAQMREQKEKAEQAAKQKTNGGATA